MTYQGINEKLARAVGFTTCQSDHRDALEWFEPDGKYYGTNILPDFPNDMNACLKWIVPILRERGLLYFEIQYAPSGRFSAVMVFHSGRIYVGDSPEVGEKPTKESAKESRAFCLATLKYFEESGL